MGSLNVQAIIDAARGALNSNVTMLALVAIALVMFTRSRFYKRLMAVLEDLLFTNWRLGLLAATGIVLSAASGWTTWDGMRNFTGEPILSGMVTFGIQGVMLIVAWLIGESFATGMNVRRDDTGKGSGASTIWAVGFGLVGILLLGIGGVAHYANSGVHGYIYGAGAVALLVGLFTVAAQSDTLGGYVAAMRVMVKSGVLWVMFLACAATSVFFSFDSLFSTIFPQDERKRAAELRASNQVAGIVADVGDLIQSRQRSEAENLFALKGWIEYERDSLQKLATAAAGSQREIEGYFTSLMEQSRRAEAEQQGRKATAQAGQAGLSNKKTSLTDELSRLKADRPGLVEDVAQKRETVEATTKEVDAKRVEVLAEEKGVEGTGKIGRGQMFRQRKAEEDSLREKLKIAEERLREPQKRLAVAEQRIVQIERELSGVDGDLAKLTGEIQTAESRIKLVGEARVSEEGVRKVDPTSMIPTFEKARQEFRQSPRAEGLIEIQRQCNALLGAMNATPATKPKVAGIDCDPKAAQESASRVFALNDGLKTFGASCQGGDKLVQHKTADALFDFARKCAQESGLASKDTDELRQKINFIELNRDDKANRFVVTWNAFQDGNRLAYLALAIAIAIDSLVFMSGLFGANAVRSPLSDVPSNKARSADQLEAIIDNALLPAKFENARIAIEAMQADTSRPGFTAVIDRRSVDQDRWDVVSRLLNAGATINAVDRDPRDGHRYFVRPELFEFLSTTANKAFSAHASEYKENIADTLKLSQVEKDLQVALISDGAGNINAQVASGAEIVLDRLHPYPDPNETGYRSELRIADFVAALDHKIARRVLNVGSSARLVEIPRYKDKETDNDKLGKAKDGQYLLHADFVKTLARLRARMLLSASGQALHIAGPRQGGALNASVPQIGEHHPVRPALAAPANANQPQPRVVDPFADLRPAPQHVAPQSHDEAGDAAASVFRQADPGAAVPPAHAAAEATALHREMVEHFAREMGQQEGTIEYLMRHAGQIDVQRLWATMDLVLRHDDAGLRRPLTNAMKGIERSIDDARGQFPGNQLTAPGAVTQLNDFADKLKSMTVIMVMLPGAAYDNTINKMEKELEDDKGAGKLDPGGVSKHKLIVRHRSELAKAEYSDDHWDAVLQSLLKFHNGLDTLAADRPPTRMM